MKLIYFVLNPWWWRWWTLIITSSPSMTKTSFFTFDDINLPSNLLSSDSSDKSFVVVTKEVLAQEKAQTSSTSNQEVDLDELMDDPELEKLHADRIAALKREAEKRQALKKQGHGEYREITEGDFLGEVTGSEKMICHFYHREFYRCKIMDKHLKSLAPRHVDTKFVKLDAENAPFFVGKLGVKTLPCVILFRKGVAGDRLVGFQDLGGKDDFPTKTLEALLLKKGIVSEKKEDEDDNDKDESRRRTVRSSEYPDSDSD